MTIVLQAEFSELALEYLNTPPVFEKLSIYTIQGNHIINDPIYNVVL